MRRRWKQLVIGVAIGMTLGLVAAAGFTHGSSGGSETEWRADQSFLFFRLYDVRGKPDDVKAIESCWAFGIFTGCIAAGGIFGLIGACWLTSRKRA